MNFLMVVDQRDLKVTPISKSSQNIKSRYFVKGIWNTELQDNMSLEIS